MKHRTAMGKVIDMDSLRAKNENVRAVGNMRINARGDIIDDNDNVITDATKRVNEQYMRSVAGRVPPTPRPEAVDERPVLPIVRSMPEVDVASAFDLPPSDIDDDIPNPEKEPVQSAKKKK